MVLDPNKKNYSVKSPLSNSDYAQQALSSFWGMLNNNDYSAQQNLANQQAAQQANAQRSQLNNQLQSAGTNRDYSLNSINNNYDDSKKTLEDTAFKNYLSSRQSIANRGLSGTGIAQDADTRLQLARQSDLASLQKQVENQQFLVNQQYNDQSKGIQDQLSQINEGAIAANLFNQYKTQAQAANMQKASAMLNALQLFSNQENADRGYGLQLRQADTADQQFAKNFALNEGQTTGNYIPSDVQSLVNQIVQSKQDWASAKPDQRQQISANADTLRNQLSALPYGIDANKLFGSGVDLQTALKNAGSLNMPTMQKQQMDHSIEMDNKNYQLNQDQFDLSKQNTLFNQDQTKTMNNFAIDKWTKEFALDKDMKEKTLALDEKMKNQEYQNNEDKKTSDAATRKAMSDLIASAKTPDEARDYILNNQDALAQNGVDIQALLNMWKTMYPDPNTVAKNQNQPDTSGGYLGNP